MLSFFSLFWANFCIIAKKIEIVFGIKNFEILKFGNFAKFFDKNC
jgi:hypothetical protein